MTENPAPARRRNPVGPFVGGLICGWIAIATLGGVGLALAYLFEAGARSRDAVAVAEFHGGSAGFEHAARAVILLRFGRIQETCRGVCDDLRLEGDRAVLARVEDATGRCLACGRTGLFGVGSAVGPLTVAKRP